MAILKLKDLSKVRRWHPDKKIVFCSGVFDLTHAGHALFFEDCKRHGDILVVVVGADIDVRKYKGKERPILNQHVRLKMIDMLKPVDYCLLGSPIKKEGLIMPLRSMVRRLKPHIYVVNEDAFNIPARRQFAKENNVKLVVCRRSCPPEFEGISTSSIIEKMERIIKKRPYKNTGAPIGITEGGRVF
ncbi:MAG: glycerol-3-phosphate cytidyltransferase [Parcubacteria group bacterium Gr01-1014_70]|nr:MAG: glycerol-3-phosphate cytidyltransferase [Parcubacteria group bacterium Gr01-1014_70]